MGDQFVETQEGVTLVSQGEGGHLRGATPLELELRARAEKLASALREIENASEQDDITALATAALAEWSEQG